MDDGAPQLERRAAPRTRKPTGEQPAVPRKAPARPRKAASSSATTVADRIDPLMAASSVEAAATTRVAPKKSTPRTTKPARPKQPAPRKRAPAAVPQKPVVDEPAKKQLEALVPYVLPKIIPGEPDTVPDELPSESPVALVEQLPDKAKTASAFKPKVLRLTKKLARSLQPVIVPRHRPRVRRVTRVVRHIDTWSVFKIALLFSIFLYAVCLAAGAMLWRVAVNTGTIENVERFFESFGWQTFQLKGGEIYHNAWIAGLFGVVGLTGLAVLAATVFNLITDLVGGVRVTVLEEEVTAREQRVVTWPRLLRPPPPSRAEPPID